jgi:hypothetical protein
VAHWLSAVHADRHDVPPALQVKSPHDIGAAVAQLPAPVQPVRAVNVAPEQLAGRQVTSVPGYVQSVGDAALHEPPHAPPPPLPAQGERAPCGGPDVTCVQVPGEVPTSQALHFSVQASLQQTASTQWFDAHSEGCPQPAPLLLSPHDPETQAFGAWHCEGVVHDSKQPALPLHA